MMPFLTHRRGRSSLVATLTGAALVAACGDRLPHPASYTLAGSVDGGLPLTLEADSACTTQLTAGGIDILDADSYSSRYTIQRLCGLRVEDLPDPGARGTYQAGRDSVRFFNAAGDAAGGARIVGDTLLVSGPLHTLRFVREREE